jgi:hypothetical protein
LYDVRHQGAGREDWQIEAEFSARSQKHHMATSESDDDLMGDGVNCYRDVEDLLAERGL